MAKTATIPTVTDPTHPALLPWLTGCPPDPDLDRLADALAEAIADLAATRDRSADLRRRGADLRSSLTTATGAARDEHLRELMLTDADLSTVPDAIARATEHEARARLAHLGRLRDLADAEAAQLVADTSGPIGDLDRALVNLAHAENGGTRAAEETCEALRDDVRHRSDSLVPAVERHRIVTEAAMLIRADVARRFGPVAVFDAGPYGTPPSPTEAATMAGDRARRAAAGDT